MTVLPGSLDYLYYNGILDHIPYEAYEMSPMTPSGMAQMAGLGTGYGMNPMANVYGAMPMQQMNGSQYLKAAQGGLLYDTYTYPDTFVHRNDNIEKNNGYSISQNSYRDGGNFSRNVGYDAMTNGQDGRNFRVAITDAASKVKNTVSDSPNWVKGFLAGGIILTTLCCLLKGKKPTVQAANKTGMGSKLNPLNWFKK